MMRKSIVISLLVGLAAVFSTAGTLSAAEAATAKRSYKPILPPANFSPPGISVDQVDYDWAKALQGTKASHDYVITNTGGSPLVISQVRASCGCTTVAKPAKPIPPGQSDVVTLSVDTKRFSGKVKKTARIFSNAKPSPLTISIGGIVETFYTMQPRTPRLNVVRGVPAEPIKVTVSGNANRSVKFKVLKVTTPSKMLTVNVTEVKPSELYEILVGAEVGESARKYFYERVNMTLDVDGKTMEVPFNVSVSVKEVVDVQPRTSVYFSRNDTKRLKEPGADPISKTLDIVSLGGPSHKFHVTGVSAAPPATRSTSAGPLVVPVPKEVNEYFDTKVETVEEGKKYRLTVTMKSLPEKKLRTIREKIRVETDDPTVKELTVTAMAAVY